MTITAQRIPGEILYHFVIKHQSVEALFNTLYDRPSELTKQHFMAVNGHLEQQVRPGQMVIITPPGRPAMHAVRGRLAGHRPPH